jgi:hypothetical protein
MAIQKNGRSPRITKRVEYGVNKSTLFYIAILTYRTGTLYIVGNLQVKLRCLQRHWQPRLLIASPTSAHRTYDTQLSLVLIYQPPYEEMGMKGLVDLST